MRIAFIGDSLTEGFPGCSYLALIKRRYPQHELINLGKGNDTVISLLARLEGARLDPVDLAVIWVGVNDVEGVESWSNRLAHALMAKPRAPEPERFRAVYAHILRWAAARAGRVIAVAPMLKGEALDSPPNRQLDAISKVVQEEAARLANASFLDIRSVFKQALRGNAASSYLSPSAWATLRDAFVLRTPPRIDAAARARGLRFTLDGVHLNSAGAELVAGELGPVIDRLSGTSGALAV